MTKKTIEIFRAGTHTAMDGRRYTFTRDDLLATAAAYDPAVFSAPAVIGHPKHDDPAYGWATTMRVEGDVLVADLDQVEPAFAEMVKAGRYKKVSPYFYPPEGKTNPVPGVYYPRHIGFLGAAAPGCQGLAPVAFADGDDDLIAFATDQELRPIVWLASSVGRMWRRMRDQLIADKGLEEADKLMPAWEVEAPQEIAAQLDAALETEGQRFAEVQAAILGSGDLPPLLVADPVSGAVGLADAAFAERQAALEAREADVARREAASAAEQAKTEAAEDAAFVDGLVAGGRLPPGLKSQVLVFCEALGEVAPLAFAEGEAAQSPRAAFKALLGTNLGTVIRFEEIAPSEGARFAEGVSADDLAGAARALVAEARARGESLSVSAAMSRVSAGH